MDNVLNTHSEDTYFCLSKNITSYTFVASVSLSETSLIPLTYTICMEIVLFYGSNEIANTFHSFEVC